MNARIHRTIAGSVAVGVVATLLVMLPSVATAQLGTAANIEFLNPSSFASQGQAGIFVSDKPATRPAAGPETYHLSAWVSDPPPNAGVEFELLQSGVSLETIDAVTALATPSALPDTYVAEWDIPDALPNGTYTLRATLFANNEAIDTAEQNVVISTSAETVDITQPRAADGVAGAEFGSFLPLATALPAGQPAPPMKPRGDVDVIFSGRTSFVRAFYTISPPGSVPEWKACGTDMTPNHPTLSSAANAGVRCTLEDPAHQTQVTAVAAVANVGTGVSFDPTFNHAGDASRVLEAYAQAPAALTITRGEGLTYERTNGEFACNLLAAPQVTVQLNDQKGQEIVGANLDVEAWGPTDKLRFDTGTLSSSYAPDRGNHALERGYDCAVDNDENADMQGEHQILGGPDIKHVETGANGTSDAGTWTFIMWLPSDQATEERHTTEFTVWVDEANDGCSANDDRFTDGEIAISNVIGWGGTPHSTAGRPPQAIITCTPPAPPVEGPVARTATLTASNQRPMPGQRVVFSGSLASDSEDCVKQQQVLLKMRKPGARFKAVLVTTSGDDGSYTFQRRVWGRREFRAVAKATDSCGRALSDVIGVAVKR